MKFTIVRGHEIGSINKHGRTIVQYQYLCYNQDKPTLMKQDVSMSNGLVDVAAYCPTCKLSVLEGQYEEK